MFYSIKWHFVCLCLFMGQEMEVLKRTVCGGTGRGKQMVGQFKSTRPMRQKESAKKYGITAVGNWSDRRSNSTFVPDSTCVQ